MENKFKNLAENLAHLRKANKLTQSELAQKLSYSDKTISKWENGDAVPDVETLWQLSKFYNISMNSLIEDNLKNKLAVVAKTKESNWTTNRIVITLLLASCVWLVAILLYVFLRIFADKIVWTLFIWAIPACSISLLICNALWGKPIFNFVALSVFTWTLLLAFHLQFLSIINLWPLYFIGIPAQVVFILWSQLRVKKKKRLAQQNENETKEGQSNE